MLIKRKKKTEALREAHLVRRPCRLPWLLALGVKGGSEIGKGLAAELKEFSRDVVLEKVLVVDVAVAIGKMQVCKGMRGICAAKRSFPVQLTVQSRQPGRS